MRVHRVPGSRVYSCSPTYRLVLMPRCEASFQTRACRRSVRCLSPATPRWLSSDGRTRPFWLVWRGSLACCVAGGLDCRGGVDRRADRPARPGRLAQGHPGGRPQGTPAPGAQLRLTDVDGQRIAGFATSAKTGQLADLELRHPATGPVRGPDQQRERHRAAEPAAARIRPEPDLVPDRRPGLRPARLDPAARPHRNSPLPGTKTAAAAAVLRRRADHPRRTPAAPAARRPVALGHPDRNQPQSTTENSRPAAAPGQHSKIKKNRANER
jgi:hypothetical protein